MEVHSAQSKAIPPHLHPPEIVRTTAYEDVGMLKVANWIKPWDFEERLDAGIVGVPLAKSGGYWKGVFEAPNAIRDTFAWFCTYSPDFDVDIRDLVVRDIGDVEMHTTGIVLSQERILATLRELYLSFGCDFMPVIIGGDHSIVRPSVRAFREGRNETVGLIQLDAHDDLRQFTWGGPTSGTPFRGILEDHSVEGRNFVQIGLHGFGSSKTDLDYARDQGAHRMSMREVRKRGVENVMEAAIAYAGDGTQAIYVSLDIDILEGAFTPGTGSPEPGGMSPGDLLEAVYLLSCSPKVKALDLVCIDPLKDIRGLTVRMGCAIILTFLTGLYQRKRGGEG